MKRFGPDAGISSGAVLNAASSKLGGDRRLLSPDEQQAVLTAFHDLFRTGHLAYGFNFANPAHRLCISPSMAVARSGI